jgi:hypothetical protein
MSTYELVRLFTYLIGVPIIIYLCVSIVRRLRSIRELDKKLREEEEAASRDPYAQLARSMEAKELLRRASRGGRED